MKNTVESYLTDQELFLNDTTTLSQRYRYLSYNMSDPVIEYVKKNFVSESTVFLFSGSWRFNFDATYIELKMAQHYQLTFAKSTLFVDPNHHELFDLTLRSLKPKNLLILHSDYWVAHRPIDQLLHDLCRLLRYVQAGGKVVCTVPLIHLNFNRLINTYQDLGFDIVGDSVVIVKE